MRSHEEQQRAMEDEQAARQAEEDFRRQVAERELVEANRRRVYAEAEAADAARSTALARARSDQDFIIWQREHAERRAKDGRPGDLSQDYMTATYAGEYIHVVAYIGSADVWLEWRAENWRFVDSPGRRLA